MKKSDISTVIDNHSTELCALSDSIWDYAETAFAEDKSAHALCEFLEGKGFAIARAVAGIETAFTASFGSGAPVIGFLGEFDALSGLSQNSGTATKGTKTPGEAGHGCGHNMLGVGSLAAALATAEYLAKNNLSGTVMYFGCPGEEGGSGKAFMAREGVFNGLDAALSWHPSDINMVTSGSSLANVQVAYKFRGVSAHAAACPHLGRSALDAVELMNVGVNFLREHIIPDARVHYAITNTGGYSPNVVQASAEVLYLIRAPKNTDLAEIYKRVDKIAAGAAMMTETELEIDFYKACSALIPNNTLEELLCKNMAETPAPTPTATDLAFATEIRASIENMSETVDSLAEKAPAKLRGEVRAQAGKAILDFIAPYSPSETASPGSTDVGDVSAICPTAQIGTSCYAASTPGHSWQLVAQGKSATAHGGMLFAGKVLAGAAVDLFTNPTLLNTAKAEYKERVPNGYICPIPQGVKPRGLAPK